MSVGLLIRIFLAIYIVSLGTVLLLGHRWPVMGLVMAIGSIAYVAMTVVLANWGIAAGQIGTVMGLLPWESLLKLGPRYAWTLAQLANGAAEWISALVALALAAWLGR